MPKRAITSFAYQPGGPDAAHVVIREGTIFADDHPAVQAMPIFFRDLDEIVVEQATSSPGEVRRGPGRPRKDFDVT